MVGKFEQEYFDVLHALEQSIYSYFVQHPELVDFQVDKALSGLVRTYEAEERVKRPPALKLSEFETTLYENVKSICEFYVGRNPELQLGEVKIITVSEMIACLKRIQRSINLMRDKGRQGYLHFISNFFMS